MRTGYKNQSPLFIPNLAAIMICIVALLICSYRPAFSQNSGNENITVKTDRSKGFYSVTVINRNPYDITMTFDVEGSNFRSSQKTPVRKVLPPFSRREILKLFVSDHNTATDFKTRYTWFMGDIYARHDDSYIYSLPYQKGKSYRLVQGFGGKYSHSGQYQYALDFEMPVGTPVYAAREGIVAELVEHFSEGGESGYFADKSNFVIIRHEDGTLGEYAHLKLNGVAVKVGDRIKKGQIIAYSGNTGYSSGPHLHFMVTRMQESRTSISLPFKFRAARGVILNPEEDEFYKAR